MVRSTVALFRRASLFDADLSETNLSGANLRRADLRVADLRRATLWETRLHGADLNGADLSETNLSAVFSVTDEQLRAASSLKGAIMPYGIEYEEWIKTHGEDGQAQNQEADEQSKVDDQPAE